MSEVKRYDIGGMPDGGIDVQQFHDGYWVKYEDYAALQQKLDRLEKEYKHVINQHMPRTRGGVP